MAWPRGISKTLSPEQRVERARKAALARTTVDFHINALAGKRLALQQRERLREIMHAAEQPGDELGGGAA